MPLEGALLLVGKIIFDKFSSLLRHGFGEI